MQLHENLIKPRGPLQRFFAGLHRFRYVLAPVSFGIGLASFLLIERNTWIAQWLAVLLLVTWVVSIFEVIVPRRLPPGLARFITQQTHQEAFFFTLPFLIKTTTWHAGQAWFTGGVAVAAMCSMWDPLYFGVIAQRRWLYLAFHALAVYVVILVGAPLLLHLTTTQTLALAAGAVALVAAPSLGDPPDSSGRYSGLLLFAGALVLAALAWYGRGSVPTGIVWVNEAAITTRMDEPNRRPVERLAEVPLSHARERGVYAFTAIKVPRGLREKVFHVWRTRGEPEMRVPLTITGGREQGYRAWTRKTGIDKPGRWRVQVLTESGQVIGELRFDVVADSGLARPAAVPEGKVLAPAPEEPVPGADAEEAPVEGPTQTPPDDPVADQGTAPVESEPAPELPPEPQPEPVPELEPEPEPSPAP